MIVVLGRPGAGAGPDGNVVPAGLAAGIAMAAAAAGSDVELVGRIGDDAAGEAVLIALGRAGVGHRAVLRDARATVAVTASATADDAAPGADLLAAASEDGDRPPDPAEGSLLDAGDIAMGLRYLPEYRVLVVAVPLEAAGATAVTQAAAFAGAALVAVTWANRDADPGMPTATILEAPAWDPDGAFAAVVAGFAVALDRGSDPATAFRSAVAAGGWERTEE